MQLLFSAILYFVHNLRLPWDNSFQKYENLLEKIYCFRIKIIEHYLFIYFL